MKIDYQELGRRIAQRRQALGLRQVQVCERCEINNNYLSNIEHAKSIPSLEVFLRICEALDATPDMLLLGIRTEKANGSFDQLMERAKGLDNHQIRLLLSIIDWMNEKDVS